MHAGMDLVQLNQRSPACPGCAGKRQGVRTQQERALLHRAECRRLLVDLLPSRWHRFRLAAAGLASVAVVADPDLQPRMNSKSETSLAAPTATSAISIPSCQRNRLRCLKCLQMRDLLLLYAVLSRCRTNSATVAQRHTPDETLLDQVRPALGRPPDDKGPGMKTLLHHSVTRLMRTMG